MILSALDLFHTNAKITLFMLIFMRMGALLMATPVFRSTGLPARLRLILALVLSAIGVSALPADLPIPDWGAMLLGLALQETLLGLAMGFTVQLVFASLSIAGESVAMAMGLGFATLVDPQRGTPVPTLSQHFVLLATLLFLVMNGHLWMIRMVHESLTLLPPGQNVFSVARAGSLLTWAGHMYAHALFIALPVLVAMILTQLTFGIITRSAPQLNVFAIGFPLMLMFGLMLLLVHVEHLITATEGLLRSSFEAINTLLATD